MATNDLCDNYNFLRQRYRSMRQRVGLRTARGRANAWQARAAPLAQAARRRWLAPGPLRLST
eukprot:4670805-Pleurochrysis_carterae.AAC.3